MAAAPRRRLGFDVTEAIRRIAADMALRLPDLAHLDLDRIAIGLCRSRGAGPFGIFARLTPLRFAEGRRETRRRGRRYRIEPLVAADGREFLYLMTYYAPRFFDQSLEAKLSTIVHELWHISPRFDGDLRRHEGRCYAHGPSQRTYDAAMDRLAQAWLAADPPPHLYEFLAAPWAELHAEFGVVLGRRFRAPRLVLA